jgi:adenylate cyclase
MKAIRSCERAIRVSPLSPSIHIDLVCIGFALVELSRFDEAVAFFKRALRQNSSDGVAFGGLASALAHLGRDAEAREALARMPEINPYLTISGAPPWVAQSHKLLFEGFRKAGARMRPAPTS